MTCLGKWNATWHFISTLFCWCLSKVETLIEQLHEAWDVQSCLFALKLVVQRKEWSRSLSLRSAQACGVSRLRHGNHSSQCLCRGYTSTFLKRPRSGSPRRLYSNLSCHIKDCQNAIYYLKFLKKKIYILYSFGTHAYRTERPVPKRFGTNTCTVTLKNISIHVSIAIFCLAILYLFSKT